MTAEPQRYIPAREYFPGDYMADFSLFGGNMMCGMALSEALRPPKGPLFKGLVEFVVCQFELNLLNQAVYCHFPAAHLAWRSFAAPFADTHLCFLGHGMGNQMPYSILRFAQEPFPTVPPVRLGWEVLREYTRFFLTDYVRQFAEKEGRTEFSVELLLRTLSGDFDCTACVKGGAGWESKHVAELVNRCP